MSMQYSAPRDQRYEQPKQLSDWTCAKVFSFLGNVLTEILFYSVECRTSDEERLASNAVDPSPSMTLLQLTRQMKSALTPPIVSC